jgi:hypothetical protein
MQLLKILWARWKIIGHKIANFQARLLLSVFYFVVVGVFAIGRKIFFSDPLNLRPGKARTWLDRQSFDSDPWIFARRQF